jgi:hypothetical protein
MILLFGTVYAVMKLFQGLYSGQEKYTYNSKCSNLERNPAIMA